MQIDNLHFFDRDGELINLQENPDTGILEANMYFEQLSIALYDNENFFILEKVGSDYKFPTLTGGQSIVVKWDSINESPFFLYDVEKEFKIGEYVINKKDSIKVSYEDILPNGTGAAIDLKVPLQLNVGFNPNEEIEYVRSLTIYLEDEITGTSETVAKLLFYGEGEDEDERFRVWLENFGIKFNRQDANILATYDIKEVYPDWKKINSTRKSLLVNHSEIYPYIGTYKGLVNFINMLGYKDTLHIKEYWKNVNVDSPYFDKLFLVDLTDILDDGKIDNLNLLNLNKNVKSGKQFVKTEFLALTYEFTKATDEFDDDGLPKVVETTDFTVDEIFYKLNQLDKKLKNEIIPINVKIKDINSKTVELYKAKSKKDLLENLNKVFTEKSHEGFSNLLINVLKGQTEVEIESVNRTLEGKEFNVLIKLKVAIGSELTLKNIIVSIINFNWQPICYVIAKCCYCTIIVWSTPFAKYVRQSVDIDFISSSF